MAMLGLREEWLDATARNPEGPAVRFSSCFPFQSDILFVVPPRSLWPPPATAVSAGKVRWKGARFVPLTVVSALAGGQPLQEDQWTVDGISECLLPAGQAGPFRTSLRWNAAIDRMTGNAERHSTACLEFRHNAGLWAVASFADEPAHVRWSDAVRGAMRLLADTGFGGERSRGWGRCGEPLFTDGVLPEMILGNLPAAPALEAAAEGTEANAPAEPGATSHWLLSLFTPGPDDAVDWKRGNYTLMARGGRVESSAGWGERKKQLQMVAEGSLLVAGETIRGAARDVAPEHFAHPVFRAGFALSIPLPAQVTA
jgi:CRISPR/Cas system CSM-associated protein Csm4 (group 5 of RAMP superfamily)